MNNNNNIIDLQKYLAQHLSKASTKTYMYCIDKYILFVGKEKAETTIYKDVQHYVQYLQQQKQSVKSCQLAVTSLKHYYYYLQYIGKRKNHPCAYMYLKIANYSPPAIDTLFTMQELQQLVQLVDRRIENKTIFLEKQLEIRNKVLLSMMIYQALTMKELLNLQVNQLQMSKGILQMGEESHQRALPLHATQILLLQEYLSVTRPYLLSRNKQQQKQDNLYVLIGMNGKRASKDVIQIAIASYRKDFPTKRPTVTRIRQSVIAHLLQEGKDIRLVQRFAGHKQAHSTEKYKYNNISQLKGLIEQYHPLK